MERSGKPGVMGTAPQDRGPWLGPQWAPLASFYGVWILWRRALYDRGVLGAHDPGAFTVSVGGLEAGGSGKTPVAHLLTRVLAGAGKRVGLVTRGYGRQRRGLVVRETGAAALPAEIGDEAAMLVAAGLDIPVAACGRRVLAARALVRLGCDVLVVDDGFAHRALARHLDVVVLCGERPLGSGHLLPWGSLREPASSLARAHVIWLHFRSGVAGEPPAWLAQVAPKAQVVVSASRPLPTRDARGGVVSLRGVPVVVAAGIARPHELFVAVAAAGARVVATRAWRDHALYTAAHVRELSSLAARHRAAAVVVTPKDAVKLAALWQGPPLWVQDRAVQPVRGHEALAARLGVSWSQQ
ncbi:MAG: tetraacyldisaccharide 4'-kinase, partial [Deltaproteobacteria bacterium]|nr:tetraacyldisaccharide 4'-kinase [Deltaproteobacteria bacterium]